MYSLQRELDLCTLPCRREKHCSRCRTSKPSSAFSPFMRQSLHGNDTRKCKECLDEGSHGKLFCSICTEWKDKTAYSAKMRTKIIDESSRKCLDCMSPVCQYPSCRTCKTCRNPECKINKKKGCKEDAFALNPKQAPKTKDAVDNFRCSNCRSGGK